MPEQPGQLQVLPGAANAKVAASQSSNYVIEFENVSRRYRLHHETKLTLQDRLINLFNKKSTYEDFWALKDISFKLERGKTLGIIGRNGAGKSTLLKLATRIIEPTEGVVRVNGRISAMLELGTGFHPELTARDNIYLNGAFYGFSRKEMDARYDRIVEFSELGKFIDTPVKHFSSGMYMRLGFAVAVTVNPDILIIDEVLAVGDAAFANKCRQAIDDLKDQSKAMILVSHIPSEISRICDEVIYIAKGQIVAYGKPGDVLEEYFIDSMGPRHFTPPPANQDTHGVMAESNMAVSDFGKPLEHVLNMPLVKPTTNGKTNGNGKKAAAKKQPTPAPVQADKKDEQPVDPLKVIQGAIDIPALNAVITDNKLSLLGWASSARGEITKVEVAIDSTLIGTAFYGVEREDVTKHWDLPTNYCGYQTEIDLTPFSFAPGKHLVVVQVRDSRSRVQKFMQPIRIGTPHDEDDEE